MDPLVCLDSDCMSLVFELLSPKHVLQCLCVSRRWRNDTQSWIERMGFRVHCCPNLPNGEEIDRVAYYRRYAQRDENLIMGRTTLIERLGRCRLQPEQVGEYMVWVGGDENEFLWQKRCSKTRSRLCGFSDKEDRSMKLPPLQPWGLDRYYLNADGRLLAENSSAMVKIYDFSNPADEGSSQGQRSGINAASVVRWEIPARWCQLNHTGQVLGASHVFSIDEWAKGKELTAHDFRSGDLAYHVRYPVSDEYAPGTTPTELDDGIDVWPITDGLKLITLCDGREILLQMQWLKPDGLMCMINIVDGATGARIQRLPFTGWWPTVLEVLPRRRRNGEVVHSFRVVRTSPRVGQWEDLHQSKLAVIKTFAYTEMLDRKEECTFQCVGFDVFILPKGVERMALHAESLVGFTIPNVLTGNPLGVFRLSPSFDGTLNEEMESWAKELSFDSTEGPAIRHYRLTGMRDIENVMRPGDKMPLTVKSFTDGRLMVSAMRGMDVNILDFE